GKLDAHGFSGSPDQTAELALDDLGLDLGKLETTGTDLPPAGSDEAAPEAPTLVAGLDETSREMLSSIDASQRTEMLPLTDLDLSGTELGAELGGTDSGLDIGLGTAETGKSPALDQDIELDLDVGSLEPPAAGPGTDDW